MRKVIDYTLIHHIDQATMIQKVKELIEDNWVPLGPCQLSENYDVHPHLQTMVRYNDHQKK